MNEKEESSIATLRASGKLALQTKENYILRIRAYLRRVGTSPDQFIQTVSRDPKAFEEDFVKFIAAARLEQGDYACYHNDHGQHNCQQL